MTWQKLIIENYTNACELFYHTFQYEKLVNITEYFYNCYEINHFHRLVLAYNPLFFHIEHKENILYLLQVFSVDELVAIHQGFRVYQPQPDSVLLSTMLTMNMDELKEFRIIVNEIEILTLPQKGLPDGKYVFSMPIAMPLMMAHSGGFYQANEGRFKIFYLSSSRF